MLHSKKMQCINQTVACSPKTTELVKLDMDIMILLGDGCVFNFCRLPAVLMALVTSLNII